jgi:molybdopterin/thiamine biosynthesis adenylyltransferase
MTAIVNLLQHELEPHVRAVGRTLPGIAYALDNGDVYHVRLGVGGHAPSGHALPCLVEVVRPDELDSASNEAAAKVQGRWPVCPPDGKTRGLVVLIALGPERIEARASAWTGDARTSASVRWIPARSDLFSRTQGLLETDLIADRKVAVVGLGSGGSAVAVDLARAGVGQFVLIDFDRLEPANISRHVCGVSDLGRRKTLAVRDAIWQRNPWADVEVRDLDVCESLDDFRAAVRGADLIIGATDDNRSRGTINAVALANGTTALFGRALTRACGGDVFRVKPGVGPCLACLFDQGLFSGEQEEISQLRQAKRGAPQYARADDLAATVQPGLAADIAPISNLMVKLALVELSRGRPAGIDSLDADLDGDFFVWANRREGIYGQWPPMGQRFDRASILRWYGARIPRNPECLACGAHADLATDGFFGSGS